MGNYYNYFNPKKCALGLEYDAERKCGVLEFAPSLNPEGHKGPVDKGTKVFNWEQKKRFNIYATEAKKMFVDIKELVNNPDVEKTRDMGRIAHSPTGNFSDSLSEIHFTAYKPEGKDNTYYTLTYKKTENKATTASISYTFLDMYELAIFMDFLEFVGKTALGILAALTTNKWEGKKDAGQATDKKDWSSAPNASSPPQDAMPPETHEVPEMAASPVPPKAPEKKAPVPHLF